MVHYCIISSVADPEPQVSELLPGSGIKHSGSATLLIRRTRIVLLGKDTLEKMYRGKQAFPFMLECITRGATYMTTAIYTSEGRLVPLAGGVHGVWTSGRR